MGFSDATTKYVCGGCEKKLAIGDVSWSVGGSVGGRSLSIV
jgi:hypothetical protein